MKIYTIYQIVCKDESIKESYVGSTIDFKDRKIDHKTKCTNSKSKYYHLKVYKFIRDNGGWFNWKFNILETIECIEKYDAYKIEQSYINNLKSELNDTSAPTGLTKKRI